MGSLREAERYQFTLPKDGHSQGWTRWKSGAWNSVECSHVATDTQVRELLLPPAFRGVHQQEPGTQSRAKDSNSDIPHTFPNQIIRTWV